ncbi:hypothetical protein MEBOL_000890 [Melittangium boletus DSM 14713]|uniref:Uncharacterized protein n=1 Tax=Melittangium boletus DSM 14713 TaxID=1294270 RepID=A0A250I8B6_9BACT|nr:hypothetical protein MEBOL_000890 [Melittangium boletus DSM 14713]
MATHGVGRRRIAAARRQACWCSARLPCIGLPEGSGWLSGASVSPWTAGSARNSGGPGRACPPPDVPQAQSVTPAARGGWPQPFPRRSGGGASCACRARAGRLTGCPKGTAPGGASAALNRAAPHGRAACRVRRGGARGPHSGPLSNRRSCLNSGASPARSCRRRFLQGGFPPNRCGVRGGPAFTIRGHPAHRTRRLAPDGAGQSASARGPGGRAGRRSLAPASPRLLRPRAGAPSVGIR